MRERSPVAESEFFQFGYVTGDLDRAMALWESRYGVPGFLTFDTRDFAPPGSEGPFNRIALGYQGAVMVELIEPDPGDPGIYRDALRSDGGTMLHHLGYLADPAAFEAMPARFAELGFAVPVFRNENGIGLIYADTRADNGLYAEMVLLTEGTRALFARIPRGGV